MTVPICIWEVSGTAALGIFLRSTLTRAAAMSFPCAWTTCSPGTQKPRAFLYSGRYSVRGPQVKQYALSVYALLFAQLLPEHL